jgi:hypothetical protein
LAETVPDGGDCGARAQGDTEGDAAAEGVVVAGGTVDDDPEGDAAADAPGGDVVPLPAVVGVDSDAFSLVPPHPVAAMASASARAGAHDFTAPVCPSR